MLVFRAEIYKMFVRIANREDPDQSLLSCLFCQATSVQNFRNALWVSNSLDPGQARPFGGPDLGSNFLQRLSADNTRIKAGKLT